MVFFYRTEDGPEGVILPTPDIFIYFAITVPVTVLLIVVWAIWRRRRFHRLRKEFERGDNFAIV